MAAAKKTASASAEGSAPKVKKKASVKNYVYATLNTAGAPENFSGPHTGLPAVLDDIGLNVQSDQTVVVYREIKRGGLKTKVKIG